MKSINPIKLLRFLFWAAFACGTALLRAEEDEPEIRKPSAVQTYFSFDYTHGPDDEVVSVYVDEMPVELLRQVAYLAEDSRTDMFVRTLRPGVRYTLVVKRDDAVPYRFMTVPPAGYVTEINGKLTETISEAVGSGDTKVYEVILRNVGAADPKNFMPVGQSTDLDIGDLSWRVGLGGTSDGSGAGFVELMFEEFVDESFRRSGLGVNVPPHNPGEIHTIFEDADSADGTEESIRQIRTAQCLADFKDVSATAYTIKFFGSADWDPGTELYIPFGPPLVTYTVSKTGPLQLQIVKSDASGTTTSVATATEDGDIHDWTLTISGTGVGKKVTINRTRTAEPNQPYEDPAPKERTDDISVEYTTAPAGSPVEALEDFEFRRTFINGIHRTPEEYQADDEARRPYWLMTSEIYNPDTTREHGKHFVYNLDKNYPAVHTLLRARHDTFGSWEVYGYEQHSVHTAGQEYKNSVVHDLTYWARDRSVGQIYAPWAPRMRHPVEVYTPETDGSSVQHAMSIIGDLYPEPNGGTAAIRQRRIQNGFGWSENEPIPLRTEEWVDGKLVGTAMGTALAFPRTHNPTTGYSKDFIELTAVYDTESRGVWPSATNPAKTGWSARHVPSTYAAEFDYRKAFKPYMTIEPNDRKRVYGYAAPASYKGIRNPWIEIEVMGLQPGEIDHNPDSMKAKLTKPGGTAVFNNDLTKPLYYDMLGRLADLDNDGVYPGAKRSAVYADAVSRFIRPWSFNHQGVVFSDMDEVTLVDTKSVLKLTVMSAEGEIARTEDWVYLQGQWKPLNIYHIDRDSYGRPTKYYREDPASGAVCTLGQIGYNGLVIGWRKDRAGIKTTYGYDGLGRLVSATDEAPAPRLGVPASLSRTYKRDCLDRIVQTDNGGLKTTERFDAAGLLVSSTDANGLVTTRAYSQETGAGLRVDTVFPDGATEVRVHHRNGRLKLVTGTAGVDRYHTYSYHPTTGAIETRADRGYPSSSPTKHPWDIRSMNWSGRKVQVATSSPTTQSYVTSYSYTEDGLLEGSLEMEVSEDGLTTAQTLSRKTLYDSFSTPSLYGIDVDGGGLALASLDLLSGTSGTIVEIEGALFGKDVASMYPQDNSAAATTTETLTRLTGFSADLMSEQRNTDEAGNLATVTVRVNPATGETIETTVSPLGTATSIGVMGLMVEAQNHLGAITAHVYDGAGRLIKDVESEGLRSRITTYEYEAGKERLFREYERASDGSAISDTTFGYDTGGRINLITRPDSSVIRRAYNTRGQLIKEWGNGTNPIWYEYDPVLGIPLAQHTWQLPSTALPDFGAAATPPAGNSVTRIISDGATALVTSKTEGYGSATARTWTYSYDIKGQLRTETTPSSSAGPSTVATSSLTITHRYKSKTGTHSRTTFSDGITPMLEFTTNRVGAITQVTEGGLQTRNFNYDYSGNGPTALALISEDLPAYYDAVPAFGGLASGDALFNRFAYSRTSTGAKGIYSGFALGTENVSNPAAVTSHWQEQWSYNAGRVASGSSQRSGASSGTTSYGYQTASKLLASRQTGPVTESRTFERNRDLLQSIQSSAGTTCVARFDFEHNVMGQRTSIKQSGSIFGPYGTSLVSNAGYDSRGNLTSLQTESQDNNATLPGRTFTYDFDSSGNLLTSGRPDAPSGNNAFTWSSNALNQITSRSNPNWSEVSGSAPLGSNVALLAGSTGKALTQTNEYFHGYHTFASGSSLRKESVNLAIARPGEGGPDAAHPGELKDQLDSRSQELFVRPPTETLSYDARGNLAAESLWTYTWNGADQLIAIESSSAAIAAGLAKTRLTFLYDWRGRRYAKQNHPWTGSSFTTNPDKITYFWWNGYELAREATYQVTWSGSSLSGKTYVSERNYHWGLGAGGNGALLRMTCREGTGSFYDLYPAYDGNGNVVALVSPGGGIAASYEYDPFGRLLRATGSRAAENSFRFATKYFDQETGLVYHDHRYYSPTLGRFISRDPAGQVDGPNPYLYAGNNPVSAFDLFGLQTEGVYDAQYLRAYQLQHNALPPHYTLAPGDLYYVYEPPGGGVWMAPDRAGELATELLSDVVCRETAPEPELPPIAPRGEDNGAPMVPFWDENFSRHMWVDYGFYYMDSDTPPHAGDPASEGVPPPAESMTGEEAHGGNPGPQSNGPAVRMLDRKEQTNAMAADYSKSKEEAGPKHQVLRTGESGSEGSGKGVGWRDVASFAAGGFPVIGTIQSGWEIATGTDMFTGEKVSRAGAILGLGLSVVPGGKIIGKGVAKLGKKIFSDSAEALAEKAMKEAPEAAADLAQTANKAQVPPIIGPGKKADPWQRLPLTLQDEMALDAAQKGAGSKIIDNLGDSKFKGMEKWEYKVKSADGRDSVVHYVRDPKTGELMDFKFKKSSSEGRGNWEKTPDPRVSPGDPPDWWSP